jgi:hypothetical protein
VNELTTTKVHWSFWVIVLFGLLWNIGGSINFFMQMDSAFVANLPETHRAIIDNRPLWATAGFAVGVFGGTLACLLMLFKKRVALYLFISSLIGVVITMIHTIKIANSPIAFTIGEIMVMIVLPLIVSALLVWATVFAQHKSWVS